MSIYPRKAHSLPSSHSKMKTPSSLLSGSHTARQYCRKMPFGLWLIWLYGFILISLSLYALHNFPSSPNDQIANSSHKRLFSDSTNPRITIFTAPNAFTGSVGARQALAVRSWLALSSQISVVLFSKDPSAASFAYSFVNRVTVDPNIDFTFLGTPFFHSMVARSQAYMSEISVMIDAETIVLSDFVSTLNEAHKIDHDWLLVASSRNVSYFPFDLDEIRNYWIGVKGKRVKIQELQETLNQGFQSNFCEGRVLMAWNSVDLMLHGGVLPPFLYQRGIYNHWIINEALSTQSRFVFDASWVISSFFLNDQDHDSNRSVRDAGNSDTETRGWEYVINSHLGALYGSLFFHEISYCTLPKLLKCDEQYIFVNTTDNVVYPSTNQKLKTWKETVSQSWRSKKRMACMHRIGSAANRMQDCSLKDQLNRLKPMDFPFSLESLLMKLADQNKTIVLAVAGNSYNDMLMSWICRMRRLTITNFLVCALDEETYQFSILQGLPVFRDPSAPSNVSFNDCHFGTKCFQRVTKVKSRIVLKILKFGYNVLLSDVDVYWFRNPLPLLNSFGPGVFAAQSDEYKKLGPINLPRRLNSGFYFVRSDSQAIAAMEKVVKHAASSGLSEQPSFYDTLCGEGGSQRVGDDKCVEHESNLTVHFLDRNLFPNGAYMELWQNKNVKTACLKMGCFILHNNWISGRIKKLERQVSSGLWDYDVSTRMCLHS